MQTEPTVTWKNLRYLADAYEQSQRIRIQNGERLRAVLQGRDETWDVEFDENIDADEVIKSIEKGDGIGPIPIIGMTYRRHWEMEREYFREMGIALNSHPVWPWLEQIKGMGPTLSCKILSRLDPEKADTVSSYWAYCGLATVPGVEYKCELCGIVGVWPESFKMTGKHKALGKTKQCKGSLVAINVGNGTRAAQPKPGRGEKASYDQYAKKICYLIGMSFLKSKGKYSEIYSKHRNRLDRERPGWPDGRKHYTALRIMEKLFLSHLWLKTREALDMPVTEPYANGMLGHNGYIDPQEMVG